MTVVGWESRSYRWEKRIQSLTEYGRRSCGWIYLDQRLGMKDSSAINQGEEERREEEHGREDKEVCT